MNTLNKYFLAMRPRTLVAAIIPPVCAFALFYYQTSIVNLSWMFLCVFGAVFIQIATNFYNDAIDDLKGADDKRVGPMRMSASGKLNPRKLIIAGHLMNTLVIFIGYLLYLRVGVIIIPVGVISILLSYAYTGGPYPLAYKGLGEIFVFIFFGLVSTIMSYYIYAFSVNLLVIVLAVQLGLLSTSLIMINNFRDKETDVLVHKNTLATKLSPNVYLNLLFFTLFSPHLLQFFHAQNIKVFMTILSMPLMLKIFNLMKDSPKAEDCNKSLKLAGLHLLLFGLLFSLGHVI